MTIDKAITIKEQEQLFHPRVHDPDKFDANQISIEALKVIKANRNPNLPIYIGLLPGETKD